MIDIMKLLITEDNFKLLPEGREEGRDAEEEPAPVQIDEESISLITAMGFSRGIASAALRRTYGNVEQAIELAIGGEISQEEAKEAPQPDAKMEDEEKIKEEEDKEEGKMEVDDPEIVVVDREKLAVATKDWLKMLFNWILTGFNSSLTDLDMENITQFMLKYVTKDEEVETLMNTCIDVMKTVEGFLFGDEKTPVFKDDGTGNPPIVLPVESEEAKKSTSRDFSSYEYQKDRKACLKKVATLTKILSCMINYLVKNVSFFKSITDYFCALIQRANKETLKFIPKEKELQIGDLTDVEPPKSEYEIFQDIVDNCLNLIIAGYGIYTLSHSTKEEIELAQETKSLMKKAEEEKKEVAKEEVKEGLKEGLKEKKSKKDESEEDIDEETLIYPRSVLAFVTKNSKTSGLGKKDVEGMLSSWNEQLSQGHFNSIVLTLIEHAGDNFDLSFTQDSFKKLMYLLLKLLENRENSEIFLQNNWFRKLLNIKSKFKHKDRKWRSYFNSIVIKLMEDENAILETSENVIRKILYFKHEEE